ncbi:SulP family inorganic anion transporter, partial [Burkholderia mallei]|uniref:SulP family inorganic anion transporter n=1 Tax=Burkholderia mallei TaxID=13373 RepID=UPI00211BE353
PFSANQELKGLGLANVIGSFFQSFAVTGGLSRTAIHVATGAKTPLASVISACVMVLTLLFFGKALAPLPYAVLGAMIMASIVSMIDLQTLRYAL